MAYEYSECVEQVKQWAQQALSEQRLSPEQAQALQGLDERTPDNLFQPDEDGRPLVVAFMGGTGVGKSSLLNRLAGQPIARTGVERPTSREVTLFHHQALTLSKLPDDLPLEKIRISQHQNDHYRNILWIDMPDFDSIEQENRQLVLEWLPHIDVLIYVVSPERYRDGKAWRLLQQEGASHAWLFVLNKWDLGDSVQLEDFKRQLKEAGFDAPVVFKTSCAEGGVDDEFDTLIQHLESLSGQHTVKELDLRGKQIRFKHLAQQLAPYLDYLDEQKARQLADYFHQQWRQSEKMFNKAFAWPITQMASQYAEKGGNKGDITLWDQWAQSRFEDIVDGVVFKASQLQLPLKALKTQLQPVVQQAEKNIHEQVDLSCRQALINPGNRLQRWTLKFLKFAEFVLPLSAMGFVSYQVFIGYYESVERGDPFLGVNFVAHSILLILLSWLIPFFLHKKLQPSLKKTAEQGLLRGAEKGLAQLEQQVLAVIESERQKNQTLREQLQQIMTQCQAGQQRPLATKNDRLRGMLIDE